MYTNLCFWANLCVHNYLCLSTFFFKIFLGLLPCAVHKNVLKIVFLSWSHIEDFLRKLQPLHKYASHNTKYSTWKHTKNTTENIYRAPSSLSICLFTVLTHANVLTETAKGMKLNPKTITLTAQMDTHYKWSIRNLLSAPRSLNMNTFIICPQVNAFRERERALKCQPQMREGGDAYCIA